VCGEVEDAWDAEDDEPALNDVAWEAEVDFVLAEVLVDLVPVVLLVAEVFPDEVLVALVPVVLPVVLLVVEVFPDVVLVALVPVVLPVVDAVAPAVLEPFFPEVLVDVTDVVFPEDFVVPLMPDGEVLVVVAVDFPALEVVFTPAVDVELVDEVFLRLLAFLVCFLVCFLVPLDLVAMTFEPVTFELVTFELVTFELG